MNRLKKIKLKYLIILISIIITYCLLCKVVPTFMRYYSQINGEAIGYGATDDLRINYVLNGGEQAPEQIELYSFADLPITLLDPTKEGYTFLGWYFESDFSGERVFKITECGNHTLYAKWIEGIYVAESNGNYYTTLQQAVDEAPLNTETTIKLLKDDSENISIIQNKNVILDFQNYTLSFNPTDTLANGKNKAVIDNKGTAYITNGTITTFSERTGAVDNNIAAANITIDNVKIITSSGRQALYNLGTAVIMPNSYLENAAAQNKNDDRATVTNTESGKLIILGGTIVAKKNAGVSNEKKGIMTIGTEGGNVSIEEPIIIGNTTGLSIKADGYTGTINFYDGVIKGRNATISNSDYVSDTENGFDVYESTEIIDDKTYQIAYLKEGAIRIRFNSDGGTSHKNKYVQKGDEVGALPIPKKEGYVFEWWYTSLDGGEEVEEERIINENIDVYAHWILAEEAYVAELNGTKYYTLQEAIDQVTDSTQVTIKLLRTTRENVTISGTQNIILDLQSHTMRNVTDKAIIENKGSIKVMNGTLRSTSINTAVINNQANCNIIIDNVKLIARGDRQAFWNNGGTSEITGNSYLKSYTVNRAACHNLESGIMTIKSATIISTGHSGVLNETGTLIIGTKDGVASVTSPLIRGNACGVTNNTVFKYYDGDIGGKNGSIEGIISEVEDGHEVKIFEEQFNGQTYEMAHLVPIVSEPTSEPQSVNLTMAGPSTNFIEKTEEQTEENNDIEENNNIEPEESDTTDTNDNIENNKSEDEIKEDKEQENIENTEG